jgi:soluble lytic murein transglycosylase-like protein
MILAAKRLLRIVLPVVLLLSGTSAFAQEFDPAERAELRKFLESTIRGADSFADRYDAEVWLVDMSARLSRFVDDPEERLQLLRQIHAAATAAELPPELVLAVIEVESHFDRFAISRVGAQGMMQVMPFWKDEIGRPDDNLTNNLTNLEYGCRILQFYLQRENGRLHPALARYNGSYGSRVYSDKVYRAWRNHWRTEPLNWRD